MNSDWHVTGAQSVLVYATMYGSIVGWDLRAPGTAWKLENDLKRGKYDIPYFSIDNARVIYTKKV